MSTFGLEEADFDDAQLLGVWPCNWRAARLFIAAGTQWRVGMAGATGLDYAALTAVMDFHGIPAKKRRRLFDDIRLMEAEALEVMKERADG